MRQRQHLEAVCGLEHRCAECIAERQRHREIATMLRAFPIAVSIQLEQRLVLVYGHRCPLSSRLGRLPAQKVSDQARLGCPLSDFSRSASLSVSSTLRARSAIE